MSVLRCFCEGLLQKESKTLSLEQSQWKCEQGLVWTERQNNTLVSNWGPSE